MHSASEVNLGEKKARGGEKAKEREWRTEKNYRYIYLFEHAFLLRTEHSPTGQSEANANSKYNREQVQYAKRKSGSSKFTIDNYKPARECNDIRLFVIRHITIKRPR